MLRRHAMKILIACLVQSFSTHVFCKSTAEPTLTQKLQLLAFKNHGKFALEIPETCFFACKLHPKQALNLL